MSGFTLIEVLIALVVISVGVLGLIALQMHTLDTSNQAYLASITSIQAMDLEERMRANPTAVKNHRYVNANLAASKIGAGNNNCSMNYCSPKQLAIYDLDHKKQWLSKTYTLLPASLKLNLKKSKICKNKSYELSFKWNKHSVSKFGSATTTNINKHPVFHYCIQP